MCDWPENAGCANGGEGSNENGGDSNGNGGENGGENGGDNNGNGESGENGGDNNGNGESSENGGDNIGNGESGENGGDGGIIDNDKCKSCNVLPWAHESDCDKFWHCDGENTVLSVCSEGLHFNPNSLTCDFICNAGCVRDDAQATLSADGIKLFLPWDKVDNEMKRLIELSVHQEKHN